MTTFGWDLATTHAVMALQLRGLSPGEERKIAAAELRNEPGEP
jgi:hypothetical protein